MTRSLNSLKKRTNQYFQSITLFPKDLINNTLHFLKWRDKTNIKPLNGINLPLSAAAFLIISLSVVNFGIRYPKNNAYPQTLGETVENSLLSEKEYWISYLEENPKYIDGWLQLTKIEHELGNINGAIKSLEEAKRINPNLSKIKKVEMELGL